YSRWPFMRLAHEEREDKPVPKKPRLPGSRKYPSPCPTARPRGRIRFRSSCPSPSRLGEARLQHRDGIVNNYFHSPAIILRASSTDRATPARHPFDRRNSMNLVCSGLTLPVASLTSMKTGTVPAATWVNPVRSGHPSGMPCSGRAVASVTVPLALDISRPAHPRPALVRHSLVGPLVAEFFTNRPLLKEQCGALTIQWLQFRPARAQLM